MSTATAPAPRSEIRDSKSEIDPPCHQPAPAPAHQAPSLTPESSSLTPQPPDQLALTIAAFLDGNMTLAEVCEYAEISLSDLHAWAQSDWARERFEMIRQLSKLRDELIQAEAVPRARQVLVHLATIADPAESAASRESRRKAAVELVPRDSRARGRAEPTSPPVSAEPEQRSSVSNGTAHGSRENAPRRAVTAPSAPSPTLRVEESAGRIDRAPPEPDAAIANEAHHGAEPPRTTPHPPTRPSSPQPDLRSTTAPHRSHPRTRSRETLAPA